VGVNRDRTGRCHHYYASKDPSLRPSIGTSAGPLAGADEHGLPTLPQRLELFGQVSDANRRGQHARFSLEVVPASGGWHFLSLTFKDDTTVRPRFVFLCCFRASKHMGAGNRARARRDRARGRQTLLIQGARWGRAKVVLLITRFPVGLVQAAFDSSRDRASAGTACTATESKASMCIFFRFYAGNPAKGTGRGILGPKHDD